MSASSSALSMMSSVSSSDSRSSTLMTTTAGCPCLVITTRPCSRSSRSTTSDRRFLTSASGICSETDMAISIATLGSAVQRAHLLSTGATLGDLADDSVLPRSAHAGVVTFGYQMPRQFGGCMLGMTWPRSSDRTFNIGDDLNELGKTCRAEGQVRQDLESIGLGVRGDTELDLSRASFTGLEPDPIPTQTAIHDPMLPQRGGARSCRRARGVVISSPVPCR